MGTIEVTKLTKRYGDHNAVDGLDLSIEDGQFITLLGPSGCGKTTTLRMLAGFIRPDEGTITVDGCELSSPARVVPPEERGMGMVFQNYALWPHKTVYHNVAYGLRMQRPRLARKEIRARVGAMLEVVSLPGFEDRFPGQLSGGQQQRVALARSLVTEPSILLLDEPLSNLDAKLRDRMREEVQEIQRRTDITFVYVTHDQGEAMSMSDRIAVMSSGRLEQFAAPRQVYHRPANVAVADFMGLVNLLQGRVVSVDRPAAAVEVVLAFGTRLRLGLTDGTTVFVGDDVTVAIRPENVTVRRSADAGEALVADVTHTTMLGHLCYYVLDLAGTTLRVQTASDVELDRGDRVSVDIDERHASVFPAEVDAESAIEEERV
ncbi:MAG: ATP-binding cassette domain-containing protein [Propionibacteriales bacterium]|nr:ATP-binding cassette domain-containing protein [Propionibacteriales bacterium]